MAFQESAQSFAALLKNFRDSSVHISCVANTLYAHESSKRPSLNDATQTCEELKLDILETHFRSMKNDYKEKQTQLLSKMNEGKSLTPDEEDWLDGKGNLIEAELLIDRLRALSSTSGDETACFNSENIDTFLEIYEFQAIGSIIDKRCSKKKEDEEKQNPVPIQKINSEKKKQKASETASTTSRISNASYSEKVQVLDWYHKNGKNQTKTALHFASVLPHLKIKQPLLSKWLKSEEDIRAKHQESSHDSTKRIRTLTYPKVEEALSEWMTQAIHYSLPLSGEILKEKWQDFA